MTEKLFPENPNDTLLSNINVSSEFIAKKKLWEMQREGKPKEKTPAHIALEKSIVPNEKPEE